MRTLFLVCILVSSSLFAYSYDSICENYFLLSYNRFQMRSLTEMAHAGLRKFNSNIDSSKDLEARLMMLEYQFGALTHNHALSKQKILERAQKYKSNPQYYKEYVESKLSRLKLRNASHAEVISKSVVKLLKDEGIPIKIYKNKPLKGEDRLFATGIELDLTKPTDKKSLKLLKKYSKKFGTKRFTVDLYENIILGSRGFSQAAQFRIDIGVDGIRDILVDDVVTMVTKHEAKHANFGNMRRQRVKSVFHSSYIAQGPTPLSNVGVYGQYMSAEELYNFANNAYWATSRLKKLEKFELPVIARDINTIHQETVRSVALAKQTVAVTDDFIDVLTKMRAGKLPPEQSNLYFFNELYRPVDNVDDAIFVGIANPNKGHVAMLYLDSKLDKKVKSYFEVVQKILEDYNKAIQVKGIERNTEAAQKFAMPYVERQFKDTKALREDILDVLIKDQKELQTYALKVMRAHPVIVNSQVEFIKSFNEAIKKDLNFIKTPEWKAKIKDFIIELRNYGRLVR